MKNINAAADLIMQYTIALVVAASMKYFGLDALSDDPTCNEFQYDQHQDRTQYVYKVLGEIVDKYALPDKNQMKTDSPFLCCPCCSKNYKTQRGLKRHMRDKHPGIQDPPQQKQALSSDKDAVFNYTRVALNLGLLAMNFNDARQMGDGERTIRLYKFLMVHFKAAKKTKYSYQVLRLLAQVKCLLTPRLAFELTWNRYINKAGKEKHNIEVDREIEHQNRVFKENCAGLRGKVTSKSIDRISRSAQTCDELLSAINKQASVIKQSGKHVKKNTKDEIALALELHHDKIFDLQPGRKHFHFPDFPCSVLSTLNIHELRKWIKSTINQMGRDN